MVERVRELICGRRGFVQENLSGQGCQTCGPGATAGPLKGPVWAALMAGSLKSESTAGFLLKHTDILVYVWPVVWI